MTDSRSRAKPLDYAGRCARYLPRRGIAYDPERLSVDRLTPRQRRRALKKERHAFPVFPLLPDIDNDPYDGDEYDDEHCSHCGGEWYLQECDDPIQCCDPRCDGQWHPCVACQGTGWARNQVIW
jgi:hypothetical protein